MTTVVAQVTKCTRRAEGSSLHGRPHRYLAAMSRGFVKEDDQEEAPFIPPRAALPDGIPNHVTPRGLEMLHAERVALEAERGHLIGSEQEQRRARAEIDGRLALLNERIVTARVVEPAAGAREVRFGSTITFSYITGQMAGSEHRFTIVGVDEADVKHGRIAFISPIARALMGRRKGHTTAFGTGDRTIRLKVLHVE